MNIKNLEWKRHFIIGQPPETMGKRVIYRCADGHVCIPYAANSLNWTSATVGAIKEYAVL